MNDFNGTANAALCLFFLSSPALATLRSAPDSSYSQPTRIRTKRLSAICVSQIYYFTASHSRIPRNFAHPSHKPLCSLTKWESHVRFARFCVSLHIGRKTKDVWKSKSHCLDVFFCLFLNAHNEYLFYFFICLWC